MQKKLSAAGSGKALPEKFEFLRACHPPCQAFYRENTFAISDGPKPSAGKNAPGTFADLEIFRFHT